MSDANLAAYIKDRLAEYKEHPTAPKMTCTKCHRYRYRAVLFLVEPQGICEICKACAEEMIAKIEDK
jgi:hypothetical protein